MGSILSAGYSPGKVYPHWMLTQLQSGTLKLLKFLLVQVDFNAAVLIHLSSTLTSHKLYLFPLQRNETS